MWLAELARGTSWSGLSKGGFTQLYPDFTMLPLVERSKFDSIEGPDDLGEQRA